MIKREFAVLTGERRGEVELSGGDLIWVVAPKFPDIHDHFCFLKNIVQEEDVVFVELENIDGANVKVRLNMVGGLEVVARKDTRQYEVLVDALLKNYHLNNRLERIKKNFAQLLCEE